MEELLSAVSGLTFGNQTPATQLSLHNAWIKKVVTICLILGVSVFGVAGIYFFIRFLTSAISGMKLGGTGTADLKAKFEALTSDLKSTGTILAKGEATGNQAVADDLNHDWQATYQDIKKMTDDLYDADISNTNAQIATANAQLATALQVYDDFESSYTAYKNNEATNTGSAGAFAEDIFTFGIRTLLVNGNNATGDAQWLNNENKAKATYAAAQQSCTNAVNALNAQISTLQNAKSEFDTQSGALYQSALSSYMSQRKAGVGDNDATTTLKQLISSSVPSS